MAGPSQESKAGLKSAVFLDRDGVINEGIVRHGKPYAPRSIEEFRLLAGVEQAVGALKDRGFTVVVVTNQPDVRTGAQRLEVVEEMHRKLMEWLPLDAIKACYHTDEDNCNCRKPKTGMITEAAEEYAIDPTISFMVGDRWRDVAAGNAAGCRSFFIDYGYRERRPEGDYDTVSSLGEAVGIILDRQSQQHR